MGSSATNDPFEHRQTNDKQVIQTNTELKFTVNDIHEIHTYLHTYAHTEEQKYGDNKWARMLTVNFAEISYNFILNTLFPHLRIDWAKFFGFFNGG